MKPLERIFFIACIKNCCFNSFNHFTGMCAGTEEFTVRGIICMFELLGFSKKQLHYYLRKWADIGFYDYGTSLDLGWFEFYKLKGEYKNMFATSKSDTAFNDKTTIDGLWGYVDSFRK